MDALFDDAHYFECHVCGEVSRSTAIGLCPDCTDSFLAEVKNHGFDFIFRWCARRAIAFEQRRQAGQAERAKSPIAKVLYRGKPKNKKKGRR